jgi:hypothetical protein
MAENIKKQMPKGGRKGGALFPKIELGKAVVFAEKLVSKTHTGPLPEKIVLPGVFDSAGPKGRVRVSALKQYALLEGTRQAYKATELAKSIAAAPKEESVRLMQRACLKPKLFKTLYDTFQSDTVNLSRIKQQASNFKVHPDSLDECVKIFVGSITFAQLGTAKDGDVTFKQPVETDLGAKVETEDLTPTDAEDEISPKNEDEENFEDIHPPRKGKAQIEIKIDPSMDPEKLEKLLAVLEKYGQI